MIVSGSLIIAGSVLAGWLYWLTGRVQRLLDHAEGALDLADRTFAALPVPRERGDGLLRWLGDAPAAGPVPPPTGARTAVPTARRAVPGPRPSPLARTDTAEMSAALDAGLRRIAQRSTGRHAAARPGGRSGA